MSFKYQAQRISDYEWLLEKGITTPIHVFMNQKLYDASEEEMWVQASWAASIPNVQKIVITADAHVGAGVPVGIVVATKDQIAPCAAGYDISCGMLSMKTKLKASDIESKEKRREWLKELSDRIATGAGTHQAPKQKHIDSNHFDEIVQYGLNAIKEVLDKNKFEKVFHKVNSFIKYEDAKKRGLPELGTLGSGNHFLELQQDADSNVWIMIHTGSRGYGHRIASEFFEEGLVWWNNNYSNNQLSKRDKEKVSFPLDSEIGQRYLNAMNQAGNYAIVNRYLIAMAVAESTEIVFKDTPEIYYEISHNFVQEENELIVHRKGATRAFPAGHFLLKNTEYENTGHPVLIPGSMGTSSAILRPVDSEKSLYSVNHGCGRVMSRSRAKKTFTQDNVNKEMDDMDILCNKRNVPIDESMGCYKDIDEVLETVEGARLAKVETRLYPRAVMKGD